MQYITAIVVLGYWPIVLFGEITSSDVAAIGGSAGFLALLKSVVDKWNERQDRKEAREDRVAAADIAIKTAANEAEITTLKQQHSECSEAYKRILNELQECRTKHHESEMERAALRSDIETLKTLVKRRPGGDSDPKLRR